MINLYLRLPANFYDNTSKKTALSLADYSSDEENEEDESTAAKTTTTTSASTSNLGHPSLPAGKLGWNYLPSLST